MAKFFVWLQWILIMMSPVFLPGWIKTEAEAARILGIFPTPSISHQVTFQAVMKELAARGHDVTVISPSPLKFRVENYSDVDLSFSYETFRKNFNFVAKRDINPMKLMQESTEIVPYLLDEQLGSPQIKEFLRNNANRTYDLVLLEWLGYEVYFGLIHAVGSPPVVGILSLGGIQNAFNSLGNPNNPAFNPAPIFSFTDRMTFGQRFVNTILYLYFSYFWEKQILPRSEELLRKHFGSDPPSVWETQYNISMLILNNHWTTEYPRAMLPSIVSLVGLHIKDNQDPLPQDLQQWLDDAKEGVIYFNLGTNVQSRDLPPDLRDPILGALARLPQRVLWKFEDDSLPGKPPNVRISKWLPQQAVLAHPNVRLFITQGGLQSFQEAVYNAVPLLVMPFLGDQQYNAAKIQAVRVGKWLEVSTLTEDAFFSAISELIEDKGYQERMRQLSSEFREHKANSMDTAVWWIEYVLRHNGAPHLRSAAVDLHWYQYLLLDVIAVLLITVAIVTCAVGAACRAVFCRKRHHSTVTVARKRQ